MADSRHFIVPQCNRVGLFIICSIDCLSNPSNFHKKLDTAEGAFALTPRDILRNLQKYAYCALFLFLANVNQTANSCRSSALILIGCFINHLEHVHFHVEQICITEIAFSLRNAVVREKTFLFYIFARTTYIFSESALKTTYSDVGCKQIFCVKFRNKRLRRSAIAVNSGQNYLTSQL
jgi:hypothetical protein